MRDMNMVPFAVLEVAERRHQKVLEALCDAVKAMGDALAMLECPIPQVVPARDILTEVLERIEDSV